MTEVIDNRRKRIADLKTIIRQLHEGASPDAVRQQLKDLVRQCDAGEIAAMEHQLMTEDNIPVQQVMKMCDLHAEVVKDILVQHEHEEIKIGHPVDIFKRENIALQASITKFESLLANLASATEITPEDTNNLSAIFNELMDVDKHYARKENILFAILERHGISGPAKVMWGIDDEIRAHLKALGAAIGNTSNQTPQGFLEIQNTHATTTFKTIRAMIDKEERILFPMSLQTLTVAEWAEIHEQSPQFGWCLIDPSLDADYTPPKPIQREISEQVKGELKIAGIALEDLQSATDQRLEAKRQAAQAHPSPSNSAEQRILFPTGSLTFQQLKLLFAHLPVDLTYVDADDRVAFYSESTKPVFSRNQAIIGRKVQNCHPPSSVHLVERILDDFKAGRQDVADFWINFGERFIFIRYFAVRNDDGEYAGCLEVTQDITRLRKLAGERRILEYDG